MGTFGEDLIQSLNEALAHTKGEGRAHRPRPGDPTRSPGTGEVDAVPDGAGHATGTTAVAGGDAPKAS